MSRIDGGNRPSSPKGPVHERASAPEQRPASGTATQGTKGVQAHRTVQTFQGRSDFEPDRRPAQRGVTAPPPPPDATAIAGADAELELLSEFPDQADAQGGLASAMLHAHANEPASQARIVERLKQDGRLESLFGEVFREGNPYVEQPHRNAVVRALGTAMARGTVTSDDLRAFARGAYAQEWRQIGSELTTPRPLTEKP
ncbi:MULTISPECIES: hypothetical protein [Myxococcus]|uniref:Uncharacterized protein n=1 Tax=Myxococcus xanthus TaxID=34 RepID=A0AAE6KQP9_MYXXA|nr:MULTISPECIES: hypothetical protein [Myxococcus]QDE66336.1 hypothetical protein BHS09_04615 [Myxococcus xanthus]QDE73609.1 hypothetical protein BHS08_04620 [Myxococcus xanthus]QDE80871.1 hypothetical protein BHS07_04510 [Myxococcus xanthus]QDE95205.1 hypothetical protein BHS05_04650 [Myxococcus xanthus]QDF02479.1 hypothetical protein BHS04_04535 [Myxococcus xanthus]